MITKPILLVNGVLHYRFQLMLTMEMMLTLESLLAINVVKELQQLQKQALKSQLQHQHQVADVI